MDIIAARYIEMKKRIIESEFKKMNAAQQAAVFAPDGQVLILAGAGSGKTTVIVNRIAYLLKFGSIYHSGAVPADLAEFDLDLLEEYAESKMEEIAPRVNILLQVKPVRPWTILAVTFTNKAAKELKERIVKMCGGAGEEVAAGTFHSLCARILRVDIGRLGYEKDFTIYDTDDVKKLIKECLKSLNLDEKKYSVSSVLSAIGKAKDSLSDPEDLYAEAKTDFRLEIMARIYEKYQNRLKQANALDFDDLIRLTVKLLKESADVLEKYQKRYNYVLVDEYQDTNKAQFLLTELLAGGSQNIMVVGDDDQSIYKFRGATIENILGFETVHSQAKIIRLEQNYRSTGTILNAANSTIKHNMGRKGKTLWTENNEGNKVKTYTAEDAYDEARFIANKILEHSVTDKREYSDFAILYRTNAQSAALEEALIKSGVHYRIFGGMKFYERKEIKDIVAYLTLIANDKDNLRLKRVINEPKRGIGDATVELLEKIAEENSLSMLATARQAEKFTELQKAGSKLKGFADLIDGMRIVKDTLPPSEILKLVVETTGYMAYMREQDKADGRDRISNLDTLAENIKNYEENNNEPTVSGFLESASLATDLDNMDETAGYVSLMTMHSAKGLEFPIVFITGLEEDLFPSFRAMTDDTELEEERRLAYVAITRAREELYLSHAKMRRTYAQTKYPAPSRFLKEIPESFTESLNVVPVNAPAREPFMANHPAKRGTFLENSHHKEDKDANKPRFAVGQKVDHRKFGVGVILSTLETGGDQKLEIAFETEGTKNLMANFAAAAMQVVE